jgi:hypothetical protein
MWTFVKKYVRENPEFIQLEDKKKLETFRNLGYSKMMDDLPIVSKYMICVGQYSAKAHKQVIDKTIKMKHPPVDQRSKDYNEDQWVRRQADYVQLMTIDYNKKKHYNIGETKAIWDHVYNVLKGEFDDFKNLHETSDKKIKEQDKDFTSKNLRNLLERIKDGTAELSQDENNQLLELLENISTKKNMKDTLSELQNKVEKIKEICSADGVGSAQVKPTIQMTETVDVERFAEIDDKYKPPELRGMIPILDSDQNFDQNSNKLDSIEDYEIIESSTIN